ncbi:hypothetical protein ACH5RR_000786 [Cinchona calisaya]|uniref:Uncharacterized protein n=1 Tax=Cinchona calisaya TaxID=153742 RepID=A0ABD3B1L1_9GENT
MGIVSPIVANLIRTSRISEMIAQENYKLGKYWAYHSFAEARPTEECWALKNKVQDLLKGGELIFVSTTSGRSIPIVVKYRGSLPSSTPLNTHTGRLQADFSQCIN